jgi:hypothetical protein
MAGSRAVRIFGPLVFLACVGATGAGYWYWRTNGFTDTDEESADDDDDIAPPTTDGGAPHKAKRKGSAHGHRSKGGAKHAAPPPASPPGPAGMSYEAAIAGNNTQLTPGGSGDAPDLTDQQLGGPMRNGTFLDACGVPSSTHVTVKVAIRDGRAVGVSVYMTPADGQAAGCVDRRVRGLAWPSNHKMDSFVTTY